MFLVAGHVITTQGHVITTLGHVINSLALITCKVVTKQHERHCKRTRYTLEEEQNY